MRILMHSFFLEIEVSKSQVLSTDLRVLISFKQLREAYRTNSVNFSSKTDFMEWRYEEKSVSKKSEYLILGGDVFGRPIADYLSSVLNMSSH